MLTRLQRIIAVVLGVLLVMMCSEYTRSYSSIDLAIKSNTSEENLKHVKQVILNSQSNNKSYYFYLNDRDDVVCAELSKGLFGWYTESFSTGSGLNIKENIQIPTNGYSRSDYFIFGLASSQVDRIEINNKSAKLYSLNLYVNIDGNEDKKLWCLELDRNKNVELRIKAYDKNNKEL
ncbi:hypothetical protein [Paenibacillus sp. KN14-4R]|uniref:hypothetical protein n=1 Tax=Paenibacillus sp. KN14-4R TaxID=3445773 RepID=UPI003FA021DD